MITEIINAQIGKTDSAHMRVPPHESKSALRNRQLVVSMNNKTNKRVRVELFFPVGQTCQPFLRQQNLYVGPKSQATLGDWFTGSLRPLYISVYLSEATEITDNLQQELLWGGLGHIELWEERLSSDTLRDTLPFELFYPSALQKTISLKLHDEVVATR